MGGQAEAVSDQVADGGASLHLEGKRFDRRLFISVQA
jgi:hypothetical protein